MTAPKRPVLRYHGGKWRLAPWVIEHFPPHRLYVEPFGGAGSVLLRKMRSYGEVYNDLENEVVNLFRVLRDPASANDLRKAVELTPFARSEFVGSYDDLSEDSVERARRLLVRAFMGFGSASMTRTHRTGFRSNSNRSGTTPAHDWVNWPYQVPTFIERLSGVVIENRDALEVIRQHDSPETLIYCDPPYPWDTRSALSESRLHCYKHEMTDDDHRSLSACLHAVQGMVIVSGYPCALYDRELYAGWKRLERPHLADGARPRMEVVWMNPACVEALNADRSQQELAV
jgi:DNA adenine methylase